MKNVIFLLVVMTVFIFGTVDIISAENIQPNKQKVDTSFVDTDGDGLTDAEEAKIGTDPKKKDTDGDLVSDILELNGYWYDFKRGKFVPWYSVDENRKVLAGSPNQEHFKTDPIRFSTDEDPYGDGMEVSGLLMDMSVIAPGNHPLVPAFPNIYVSMQSYEVTAKEKIVSRKGGETQSSWTNSTTDETTWEVHADGKLSIGSSAEKGAYGGLELGGGGSFTSKHSVTKSNSGLDKTEWDNTVTADPSQAASLKLDLVFQNFGTATAREVVPMITALVGNSGIATYKMPEDKKVDVLAPGDKSATWVCGGGTVDEIITTIEELKTLQMGSPLIIAINQMDATVKKQDEQGGWSGTQKWSDYKPSIDGVSTHVLVDMHDGNPMDYLVYAQTLASGPIVTVRDMLKYILRNDFVEKEGGEYTIKGVSSSKIFFGFAPKDALVNVQEQLKKIKDPQILDVVISPKWTINVQLASEQPDVSWAFYNNDDRKASTYVNSFYQLKAVEFLGQDGKTYSMADSGQTGIYSCVLPKSYSFLGTEKIQVTNVLDKQTEKLVVLDDSGNPIWAMFSHDAQHTGRSEYTGPQKAQEKWRFKAGAPVQSSPAIDGQGMIIVGADNGILYAITPDGNKKWAHKTGGPIKSSPAISQAGIIYVTSNDQYLYALDPSGNELWKLKTGDTGRSSPAVGADGTIYAGSTDGNLYAVRADGTQKWKLDLQRPIGLSSPALGADGTVYLWTWTAQAGTSYGYLTAVQPDGKVAWTTKTSLASSLPRDPSPMVDSMNNIWFADGSLFMLVCQPNGKVIGSSWVMEPLTCPALGVDGTVYGTDSNCLLSSYVLKPDGVYGNWTYNLEWQGESTSAASSPAVGGDGLIYVGSQLGWVYAVQPDGKLKWKYKTGGSINSSPAIGADGTLYIGSSDGYLYALGK